MKNKPTVWLAREADAGGCANYVMRIGKPPMSGQPYGAGGIVHWHEGVDFRAKDFESITPKSCHLKPGEGPIKINVKIERAK